MDPDQAPHPVVVPSEPEPAIVHEQSGVGSESVPSEAALPPGDVSALSVPLSFAFAQDVVTVSEGDNMVSVVVERTGGLGDEACRIVVDQFLSLNISSPSNAVTVART